MAEIIRFVPKPADEFARAAAMIVKAHLDWVDACFGMTPQIPSAQIIQFPQKERRHG